MTHYLSPQQVLFIHARLITATGGEHDVRDMALLQSAVARPQATFDGDDLYPTLPDKAAALMHSLLFNHPFIDGNERTAVVAAALFLQRNHHELTAGSGELERFTISVLRDRLSPATIATWFRVHCPPTLPWPAVPGVPRFRRQPPPAGRLSA